MCPSFVGLFMCLLSTCVSHLSLLEMGTKVPLRVLLSKKEWKTLQKHFTRAIKYKKESEEKGADIKSKCHHCARSECLYFPP